MTPKLECPYGEYRPGMKIWCKAVDNWCGNVYFKRCKGWWTQSDAAKFCTIRKNKTNASERT